MPTDPFVPSDIEHASRQETNMAPGVHMPPAKAWTATRPGDLVAGQPTGELLGRPGPNVGYAISLANRLRDKIVLGPHESIDDALAIVSELGMKRASSFGRAPTMADVEIAATLLGYTGAVAPEFVDWRAEQVHGAHHEYGVRRGFVDAVPDAVLRHPPQVPALLDEFRAEFRQALEPA